MLDHGKSRLTFKIKQFKQKHDSVFQVHQNSNLARSSSSLMRRFADEQANGQDQSSMNQEVYAGRRGLWEALVRPVASWLLNAHTM